MSEKIPNHNSNTINEIIKNFITSYRGNIAAYSFFSAIIVTTLTLLAKLYIYVYHSGYFSCLNINKIYINISSQNLFYDIFFYFTCILIFFIASLFPYFIYISKYKIRVKIFLTLLLTIFSIILFYGYIISVSNVDITNLGSPTNKDLQTLALYTLWFLFIFYMLGIFSILANVIDKITTKLQSKTKKSKKDNHETKKHSNKIFIFVIIGAFIVYVIIFYGMGYSNALDKNSFKFTDKSHVVIFEDKTNYIIADCSYIDENVLIINTKIQNVIDKINVETEKIKFKRVKIEN